MVVAAGRAVSGTISLTLLSGQLPRSHTSSHFPTPRLALPGPFLLVSWEIGSIEFGYYLKARSGICSILIRYELWVERVFGQGREVPKLAEWLAYEYWYNSSIYCNMTRISFKCAYIA